MLLYMAEYIHVFSGNGRAIVYEAPSREIGDMIADGLRESGELIMHAGPAQEFSDHPISFKRVEFVRDDVPKYKKTPKRRTIRISR
jgi:hypothetical protein